jgi:hypothetical protein
VVGYFRKVPPGTKSETKADFIVVRFEAIEATTTSGGERVALIHKSWTVLLQVEGISGCKGPERSVDDCSGSYTT